MNDDPVWLAAHGVASWCPDWCQESHDPVVLADPSDDVGRSHHYVNVRVGHARATYCMWASVDGAPVEHLVILDHDGGGHEGFDGYLQIPLAALPDVVAALQQVPIPSEPTSSRAGAELSPPRRRRTQ